RDDGPTPLPDEIIPSDVPAWWLVKKKNALYYSGEGRGDFGKFLLSSALLTMNDSTDAAEVNRHMPDVLSYINSLEAPAYPGSIDPGMAARGKVIFAGSCGGCHGSYGSNETYPNKLVHTSVIGTDPWLARSNFNDTTVSRWFNNSWFSQGPNPAWLQPFDGYLAPPLDGIWATAPYLHNGSVPALEMMIDSRLRPVYWKRGFGKNTYDIKAMAIRFDKRDKPGGKRVYDTTLKGYGNSGHTFGDQLTPDERKVLLEYLKTL
ncbi:MAG: c-type cytochrome, partial [Chitinophagaceae bacterium]